jgi:hypothetical protein
MSLQSKMLLELPNLRCIKREGEVSDAITLQCPFDRALLSEREGEGRRGDGGRGERGRTQKQAGLQKWVNVGGMAASKCRGDDATA